MDAVRQILRGAFIASLALGSARAQEACTQDAHEQAPLLFFVGKDAGEQRGLFPCKNSINGWIEAKLSAEGLRLNYRADAGFELIVAQVKGELFDAADRPIPEGNFALNANDRSCQAFQLSNSSYTRLIKLPAKFWKIPDGRRLLLKIWTNYSPPASCD